MATTVNPNPVADEQDASAEAPDVETNAEAAERILAEQKKKPAKRKAAPVKTTRVKPDPNAKRDFLFRGEVVKVPKHLTDAKAEDYARKALAARDARKSGDPNGKGEKPVAKQKSNGKAKVRTSVPAGSCRMRMNRTSFENAITGKAGVEFRKANGRLYRAIKDTPDSSFGATRCYRFVVAITDAKIIQAHLLKVAKAWQDEGVSGKLQNPKHLLADAATIDVNVNASNGK